MGKTHLQQPFPPLLRDRMETPFTPTMIEQPPIVKPGNLAVVPFDDDLAGLVVMRRSGERLRWWGRWGGGLSGWEGG